MSTWLLKGVAPYGGEPTDLLLRDGVVAEGGSARGAQVLDAAGLVALPGLVDLHTHLREPPAWSSRCGGWAGRPGWSTSARSAR